MCVLYVYTTYINMSKTQQYLALAAQFERKRPGGWCSIVVWRQRERLTQVCEYTNISTEQVSKAKKI